MNHVIETIGPWGVKSTPVQGRMNSVHAGDVVQFPEQHRRYPVSCAECRVSDIDKDHGMVHLVDGMGSAFIDEDARLSISGGPFFSLPIECLEPMHTTHRARFWNWGDNRPGAAQGVDYYIDRPMFRATASPNDHAIRYSHISEEDARQGGVYRHQVVDPTWLLVRTWEDHDGETAYLFAKP